MALTRSDGTRVTTRARRLELRAEPRSRPRESFLGIDFDMNKGVLLLYIDDIVE